MASAYPTMSVAIDSTLLTGTYPNIHRVPGLVWYNQAEQRIVNYGSDKKKSPRSASNKRSKTGYILSITAI
ncbi:alkaline phosphatase family protein [Bacillus licheniformis]|nr:alkaline phosphatase family protein [Bacillus licheniformis]